MMQDTDAFPLVNLPGLHIAHIVEPGILLIQPFGQTAQAAIASSLNVPGIHFEHETEPFPLVNSPALHAEQLRPFGALAMAFFGHGEHDSEPLCGATFPG